MKHKFNVKYILLLQILALTFTSCQKNLVDGFEDLPVIEAYLSPGNPVTIKISHKIPYQAEQDSSTINLNHLEVYIISGNKEHKLISIGNGIYADSLSLLEVIPDSMYKMRMIYNEHEVSSETIIPVKPTGVTISDTVISIYQFDPDNPSNTHPSPVEITWTNADASYYLITAECLEENLIPIIKDSIPSNDIFASQPVTGNALNIQPMMFRYFGKNRIILYHINPEYSTFFMRQASNSQSFEEPPSNIENGLGIFTGINADTMYIRIIQK